MATFIKISTITVGAGGAASIDFTSIPATYTDLVVKVSGRSNRAANKISAYSFSFNGSTVSFTYKTLEGNGSAASSFSSAPGLMPAATTTASTFGSFEIYIPNYASANYKSWSLDQVTEDNATASYADLTAGLWSNTAAINQITLADTLGSWVQYSSATLYGIKSS